MPNVSDVYYMNDPSDLSAEEQVKYAANHDVALSYLAAQLQLKKKELSNPFTMVGCI
ncbi:hypothetical protein RCO48_01565 [Peribacillus frigoritolerans]|nr:hypothetical protein [Peribacillus frigoritolerans]